MLNNYLKIALRNICKHKGYTVINITGLTIGLMVCMLIVLWVIDELSYDRFHSNGDNAFLMVSTQQLNTGQQVVNTQQAPLAPTLQENIPEIINYVRYFACYMPISYQNKSFNEQLCLTDPSYFSIFSFPLIEGDIAKVLVDPHSIVISEKIAQKYFGDEKALGQVLTINNQTYLTVTGVMKNIPDNSTLQFEVVVPFALLLEYGENINEWKGADYYTYFLFKKDADIATINEKFQNLSSNIYKQRTGKDIYPYTISLVPLTALHLQGFGYGGGSIQSVYIMIAVAVIILLIACMNFINITTARSAGRAKEIGLRKVVGASRADLIRQLLGEAVLLALGAFILALVGVELVLPVFNDIAQKSLSISLIDWKLILSLLMLMVITGILSGGYTAFYISGFQPVKVLKGIFTSGRGGMRFRRILVVVQFTLSVGITICTLVLFQQIEYIKNKNLGYDKNNVLCLRPTGGVAEHYDSFKEQVLQYPDVLDVTSSNQNLVHINSTIGNNWSWEGRDPNQKLVIHFDWVSYDYAKTMKMEMLEGRFYSPEFPSDTLEGLILNESLVRLAGIENPIGKKFSYWGRERKIIGVVKDFHLEPLYESLKPMILIYSSDRQNIYIRIDPDYMTLALSHIKQVYEKFEPNGHSNCYFLNEAFNQYYVDDTRLLTIFKYASFLTIIVSCLGLFGLVTYMTEHRTREIGIRKVLGSSVMGIIKLISKEFILHVIIANVVAWPLAFLMMNYLLQKFAYRENIDITVFIAASFLFLVITISTVGYQAVKAALTKPVKALRYE
ncbi:MAG: ABC transporter permease [candidate division Zixibacteria bacterium]|nr:ABC transporter permease [candidate division Zixibacteria bacterium]